MKIFLRITAAQIDSLVRRSREHSGAGPSDRELGKIRACLTHFNETWQTAKEALGKDEKYAALLHSAGLLCRIEWPIVRGGSSPSIRWRVVYCVDPTLLA